MAKRRHYSDKFKAGALVMLQAQGYPENARALEGVARHLRIPGRTLRRWFTGENGRPPDEVVLESKKELAELFEDEIRQIMRVAEFVREDANYRDLITSAAILTDKRELLHGKPTERSQQQISVSGLEHLAKMSDDEVWGIIRATNRVETPLN